MQPDLDDGVIRLIAGRLGRRARPTRETAPLGVRPHDLFVMGIERMNRVEAAVYEKEDVRAVQYGDGLAMAILASVPIRLRNLIGLKLGSSLNRVDGAYRIVLSAQETKGKRAYAGDLPSVLTPYIDRYIERHRRKLLDGQPCDHLFISCYRGPMSANTMRGRFKDATEQMLGVAITPHQARAMAATAIAEDMPERIGIATPLLGHARQRTTREHYNMADQISAGRTYNADLITWRAEAHEALRDGGLFEEEP
jgi:integrase